MKRKIDQHLNFSSPKLNLANAKPKSNDRAEHICYGKKSLGTLASQKPQENWPLGEVKKERAGADVPAKAQVRRPEFAIFQAWLRVCIAT